MATACIAHSALRVHGISKPIMQTRPYRVRFIDSIHADSRPDVKVRF